MILQKLNFILERKDKEFLIILIFLSVIFSFIEMLSIASIMPFMEVASNFSKIHQNTYYNFFYEFFNFKSNINFIISFGLFLIFFYIFRGFTNLFYTYTLIRFSQGRTYSIANRLFTNYLKLNYKDFINKNNSHLIKNLTSEASNVAGFIQAVCLILSEISIIILIYIMMLIVSFKITLVLTIFLILNAFLLSKTVSKKIKALGKDRERFFRIVFENISSTMGNFKLIKLKKSKENILETFKYYYDGYSKANIKATTLSNFPRVFLESLSFIIIVLIVVYFIFVYKQNLVNVIPKLSVFVLALYRLMPSVNRIMTNYNQILYLHKSIDLVYEELKYDLENIGEDKLTFTKEIKLENISFFYKKDLTILDEINLKIEKGSKIAFIGESGSGKSTLVDIIIGLYKASKGNIFLDEEIINNNNIASLRNKVGYIPQSVYLFDGDVASNVCFGNKYDKHKLIKVLKQANIYDFLKNNHEGLNTKVGDGGIKLSGGQKQRIAIARAIYSNPEILVLDEATSALDNKTEEEIMNNIYELSKNLTLIIIAHRLNTIKNCDKIYEIKNKKLHLVNKKSLFKDL